MDVTNISDLTDGFGECFKFLVYSVFYAELTGQNFYYTPFAPSSMQHNYDNDPNFLQKKEELINFIGNFPRRDVKKKYSPEGMNKFKLISTFENNIDKFLHSQTLKKVKKIFWENKRSTAVSGKEIAVHIRRANNPHDKATPKKYFEQIPGTDVPDNVYIDIITQLKKYCPEHVVKIYSQGNKEDFSIYENLGVVLNLNGPVEPVFIDMVCADVLVIAPSALSYMAGILSDGVIYYISHCHKPLPNWNVIKNYISSRDRYRFFMKKPKGPQDGPLTVYYDPEKEMFYKEALEGVREYLNF